MAKSNRELLFSRYRILVLQDEGIMAIDGG